MGFSTCWKCKTQFWMPDDLESVARRDGVTKVYCAHGHSGVFSGRDDEKELRLERDRLKQQLAQKDDEIRYQKQARETTEHQLRAQKGIVTKLRKRASNGVCPCCTRSFQNLKAHMATQHPDFSETVN